MTVVGISRKVHYTYAHLPTDGQSVVLAKISGNFYKLGQTLLPDIVDPSIIAVATVLTTVFEIPSTPLMIPRFEGVSWYD